MIVIESLDRDKHRRISFDCGVDSLDKFLQEHAVQAAMKSLSKTYVAVDGSDETVILGYYTVTPCRIEAGTLPVGVGKRIPTSHDLPASLIARLAVSQNAKGNRIGSFMVMDALARCARVSTEIGGIAVVVDALTEDIVPFYEQFGFQRFSDDTLKMFIMMDTIRTLVAAPAVEQQEAG